MIFCVFARMKLLSIHLIVYSFAEIGEDERNEKKPNTDAKENIGSLSIGAILPIHGKRTTTRSARINLFSFFFFFLFSVVFSFIITKNRKHKPKRNKISRIGSIVSASSNILQANEWKTTPFLKRFAFKVIDMEWSNLRIIFNNIQQKFKIKREKMKMKMNSAGECFEWARFWNWRIYWVDRCHTGFKIYFECI